MKHYKRTNMYRASNVSFDPTIISARSYDHWKFVTVENEKVIFNHYPYSPTTQGHQRKVRSLMRYLNIEIDIEVDSPQGLQATGWKNGCIKNAQESIVLLEKQEAKGRKGTLASDWRLQDIAKYKQMIEDVNHLKD